MFRVRQIGRVLDRASPWIAITLIVIGGVVLHNQGNQIHSQQHALRAFVAAESVQRVHTIGERCETTRHETEVLTAGLGARDPQSVWFAGSSRKCLRSLAKVEKRAGVTYEASP